MWVFIYIYIYMYIYIQTHIYIYIFTEKWKFAPKICIFLKLMLSLNIATMAYQYTILSIRASNCKGQNN